MKIFVQLEHGRGGDAWSRRFRVGEVYETTPYGHGVAEDFGHSIRFSTDRQESVTRRAFRRILRRVLGFDIMHVLSNRGLWTSSDVVWTHTEDAFLAFGLLRLMRISTPPVVAQSIWLIERLGHASGLRKLWYRSLLRRDFQYVTHTRANMSALLAWDSTLRVAVSHFGVSPVAWEEVAASPRGRDDGGLRVACMGNDRHRDWQTVDSLARRWNSRAEVRVASRTQTALDLSAVDGSFAIWSVSSVADIKALLSWADVLVLSVHPNLHASGLTSVCEAVYSGVPVVASRCGGIDEYFPEGARITYVAEGAGAEEWYDACLAARAEAPRLTAAALTRASALDLTSAGYTRRLIELSELFTSRPDDA